MSRIFTQVNEDYGLYKIALAYYLTMRGIPQIYYGTEILMSNPGTTSHGIIRSDFPGGWPGDTLNIFHDFGMSKEQKEAKEFNKKINNWRKNNDVVHHGKLMHYIPYDGVYVYFRYLNDQVVMVILNKNQEETALELSRFSEFITQPLEAYDVIEDRNIKISNQLMVPPRSPMILEFDR